MLLLSFVVYITAYFGLVTSGFFLLTYLTHKKGITDPKTKKLPSFSFIVPVFNEEGGIKDTILSLLDIDYPKDKVEIIVIDDGSTDNTYKILKSFQSKRVRVFRKRNGGCATALNFGIRKARGEFIVRFDADTLVARDALKKMVGYFDNPKVMAVTSSLNVNNHKGFLQGIQWAEYLFGIALRKIFDMNDAIHVIPGPLSVYRAEFFKRYGGFDEKNMTEDTEMAMRIQSHGYQIRNSISANVYTNVPTTFNQLLKQRTRWYTGFMHNAWNYRHLYSLKRKTNLSMFILPIAIISVILAFFAFFVMLYYNIQGFKDFVTRISVTSLSFNELFGDITLKAIGDSIINYVTSIYLFFIILGILIMMLFFSISKYHSGEKRRIMPAIMLYFLFYIFFFLLWWGFSIFYFATGKEQVWGRRRYSRAMMICGKSPSKQK